MMNDTNFYVREILLQYVGQHKAEDTLIYFV